VAPQRSGPRADVRAAEAAMKAREALSRSAREDLVPAVDLFGSLELGARAPTGSDAISNSFSDRYPSAVVGLRLQSSLGVGALLSARSGRASEEAAAQLEYRRRLLEEETEWKDMVRRFTELQDRVGLAFDFEEAQRLKLDYERKRYRQGKSTAFQIVLFERDFVNAQLTRIGLHAELLGLSARMKIFGGAG